MNPKFFDVKKEKQDAIINACLKVFAENGYKKASTDVIVKTAGISKGLLFHYFESKKGAYEFIFDYSVKYMTLELTQSVKKSERDFFEIQKTIEGVKTRVMKNYPYMQQFLDSVRFEEHPDALAAIGKDKNVLRNTYNEIYRQADMSRFDDSVDVKRVINMIGWMSEGYIRDRFREEEEPDLDEVSEEFAGYLQMLRNHFYRSGDRRLSFAYGSSRQTGTPARNTTPVRNTAPVKAEQKTSRPSSLSQLANQMAREPQQLSFEERLARRDTSIFGVPIPPKEEKKEEKKIPEHPAIKAEDTDGKKDKKSREKEKEEIKAVSENSSVETSEEKAPEQGIGEASESRPETTAAKNENETAAPEILTGSDDQKNQEITAQPQGLTSVTAREEITEPEAVTEQVGNGEVMEPERLTEGPDPKPAEETGRSAEPLEFLIKDGSGNDADSDMIDLSALFSRRLEEATEELMTENYQGFPENQPAEEQGYIYPEVQPGDPVYDGQPGYYGQVQYPYPPMEGYDPDMGFPGVLPLPEGYVFEDDSQAYAELYNSVNNYDMNGATQEMPINEVLAYRNAFTSEYIREELEKNRNTDQQQSQPNEQEPEKKEKKPKKKSFFAGLFGKGNKEEDSGNTSGEEGDGGGGTAPDTANGPGENPDGMGKAPVLPEFDPNAAGMGNYEPTNYYNMKF